MPGKCRQNQRLLPLLYMFWSKAFFLGRRELQPILSISPSPIYFHDLDIHWCNSGYYLCYLLCRVGPFYYLILRRPMQVAGSDLQDRTENCLLFSLWWLYFDCQEREEGVVRFPISDAQIVWLAKDIMCFDMEVGDNMCFSVLWQHRILGALFAGAQDWEFL